MLRGPLSASQSVLELKTWTIKAHRCINVQCALSLYFFAVLYKAFQWPPELLTLITGWILCFCTVFLCGWQVLIKLAFVKYPHIQNLMVWWFARVITQMFWGFFICFFVFLQIRVSHGRWSLLRTWWCWGMRRPCSTASSLPCRPPNWSGTTGMSFWQTSLGLL